MFINFTVFTSWQTLLSVHHSARSKQRYIYTLRVPTTVIACCVLHNLCIEEGDDAPVEPAIIQNDVDVNVEDSNEGPVDDEDGILLREAISNYLERHSNIY